MAEQIGNSPAGVIEPVSTHKVPKRHIYWRPILKEDKVIDWTATLPLPAETAQDREQYLSRGFKWDDPRVQPIETPAVVVDDGKDALYKEIAALQEKNAKLSKEIKAKGLGGSSL